MRLRLASAASALLAACGGPFAAESERGLIYGSDTRLEPYQLADPRIRELVQQRAVALFDAAGLEAALAGSAPPLRGQLELCPEERFLDQPAAARCSGVLLDRLHVLTAGHCAEEGLRAVVGYGVWEEGAPPRLAAEQVYRVEAIEVARTDGPEAAPRLDHALLRLDRPAPVEPLPVAAAVEPGEALIAVGHPAGLPAKVDAEGWVESRPNPGYFLAALDLYRGSSGSGVYNQALELVGVAARGPGDYLYDLQARCFHSRTSTVGAEAVSYAARALAMELPATAPAAAGCRCLAGQGAPRAPAVLSLLMLAPLLAGAAPRPRRREPAPAP